MSENAPTPISEKDIRDLFRMINTETLNFDAAAFASQFFEFEGFDPAKFIRLLLEKNNDKSSLMEHMIVCLTWIAMRGTNVSKKNTLRTSTAGQALINSMIEKYDIKPRLTKNRNQITMGRISAVFAPQMVQILSLGIGRVVGVRPVNLPKALCFPSAPAVIPNAAVFDPLFNAWLEWSMSFTAVIQPVNRQAGVPNSGALFREQSEKFGNIARKSSLLSDKQRVNLLISCGILVLDETGESAFINPKPKRLVDYGKEKATLNTLAALAGGAAIPTELKPKVDETILLDKRVEDTPIKTVNMVSTESDVKGDVETEAVPARTEIPDYFGKGKEK